MSESAIHRPGAQPAGRSRRELSARELAERLGEVARELQGESDTDRMLGEVVAAAVGLVPGAEEASLSALVGRRQISPMHATGEVPERITEVQTEVGQGPCLESIYEQHTVWVDDFAVEERWAPFSRRAHDLGVRSMLSFELKVRSGQLGSLSLYSRQPHAFDDESRQVGELFATHVAVAFASARQSDQLNEAVAGRDLIGQAKGILMERFGLTEPVAFAALTRVSQQTNRKLRDVAAELVETGRL